MSKQNINERIARLLETGPAVVYTAKAYGDYGATFISGNIRIQMGYEPEDFTNDPNFWVDHIHPDDVERVLADLEILYREDYHVHEYRFRKKNGEYIWMRDELKLYKNDKGEPLEIIGYWVDISDQKKTDRIKDELISVVSHELRTPLTSIRGALVLLKNLEENLSEKGENLLDISIRNTNRINQLVDDLLIAEKLSSGKMDLDVDGHDVMTMIKNAIDENQPFADNHGIVLSIGEALADVKVSVDEIRFMQVLTNLMSNSIKFSQANSTVTISATANNGIVCISLRDEGCGISKDFQPYLFDRFTQADTTDSRNVEGSGLGLSICKQLVEMMKGQIGFESVEGRGTTFYINIPVWLEKNDISRLES